MKKKTEFAFVFFIIFSLILSACFSSETNVRPEMQVRIPTNSSTNVTSTPPAEELTESAAGAAVSFASSLGGIHLHYPVQTHWIDSVILSGVHWTRLEIFFWDKIEPQKLDPPVYDWSQVDEKSIIRLSKNGIQLIADILYTPEWAQKYPGVACGPIAEADIERFADFMSALVARYSQPPYNIKIWEIGNEPDIDHSLVSPRSGFGCWGDANDPYYGGGYYAKVLQAVYPLVKEADPQAQLLPGGLLLDCDPSHPTLDKNGRPEDCAAGLFLEGILQAGGGAYIDGISFHGYDYYGNLLGHYENPNWHSDWQTTGPVWISKLTYLRSLLKASGIQELPFYLTELAAICGRDGSEEYCHTQELEQTKAIYAVQSLAAAKAEGLEAIIWYGIEGWRASGMLQQGNPLPIYHAMSFFEANISNAEFTRLIEEFPNIKGYVFNKADQEIWLLWSSDGKEHQIELTEIPNTFYNVEGKEIMSPSTNLEVTVSPVYIFW